MPRPNDKIGPYTLIAKLGRGAFGVVWLAEKRSILTTTKVALKLPHDEDVDLQVVRQEAAIWVHASGHPNVLPIIDADIHDEHVVIVSEYAPDGSLTKWLDKHGGGAPTVESAVEMMLGVLAGLEHLHEKGIIHRDLKPDNILLQRETPRLADFGIARILKTTSKSTIPMGTPVYMSPEAFDGKRNEQTDVWSVGVIFYRLLAGHLPFEQTDMPSLLAAIVTKDHQPLPESIPHQIRSIVERALRKDPQTRWQSASDMRRALKMAAQARQPKENQIEVATTIPASDLAREIRAPGLRPGTTIAAPAKATPLGESGDTLVALPMLPATVTSNPSSTVSIDEPVIAININQQYEHAHTPDDLYNCTRGIWRLNPLRAERAKYFFSVYKGIIREVYELHRCIPATKETIEYWDKRQLSQGRHIPPGVHEGRFELIGKLAQETIRKKYVGRNMPVRQTQNPVRYINC